MTEKKDDKKSFIMYSDYEKHFELLSIEERGILITAIFYYIRTGIIQNLDGAPKMAFSFIKANLDRDNDKWLDTKEKRVESGRLGGLASGESRRTKAETE